MYPTQAGFLLCLLSFSLIGSAIMGIQQSYGQTSSHTGNIKANPAIVGPGTIIHVSITDQDLNINSASSESYSGIQSPVTFTSTRNEVGQAIADIKETSPNSGVFGFTLRLVTDGDSCWQDNLGNPMFSASGGPDPSIGVCPDDILSVKYHDEENANGNPSTISIAIEVKSFDPIMSVDKDTYQVGDAVVITIDDQDANIDSNVVNTITIRTSSSSDAVGFSIQALETGSNTGVFTGTIKTSNSVSSGKLSVKNGDNMRMTYLDAFPSDFGAPNKVPNWTYVIVIGSAPAYLTFDTDHSSYRTLDDITINGYTGRFQNIVTTNTINIDGVELTDINGHKVDYITPNQIMLVRAKLSNNNAISQPYVAVTEIRDAQGETSSVQMQGGTLNAQGQIDIGLSWTPKIFDHYLIRICVIDNFTNMQPLSKIATYNTTSREFAISDIGQGSQPLLLRIQRGDGTIVLIDQVRIEPSGSFTYTTRLGDMAINSGNYQVVAAYDNIIQSKSFIFSVLENDELVVDSNGRKFPLQLITNSIIKDTEFDQEHAKLSFTAEGESGTSGVLYAKLPIYLLDNVRHVSMDGKAHEFTDLSTHLFTIIKIEYTHSIHKWELEGERWFENPMNQNYSVFYKPDPCVDGYPAGICNVHKDHWGNLKIFFVKPDGVSATIANYSVRFGNTASSSGSVREGEAAILSIPFRELSPSPSDPFPKTYSANIEVENIDGRFINDNTEIQFHVVPEFPLAGSLAATTIFISVVIFVMRIRFSKLQPRGIAG